MHYSTPTAYLVNVCVAIAVVKAYSKREKMMQDNQIEGDEQMCLLRGELNNSSDLIDQSNRQVLFHLHCR